MADSHFIRMGFPPADSEPESLLTSLWQRIVRPIVTASIQLAPLALFVLTAAHGLGLLPAPPSALVAPFILALSPISGTLVVFL